MFEILYENMETTMDEMNQKHKLFFDRTNYHIDLVKKAAAKLVDAYPEYVELLVSTELHDASKFVEPEKTPYIELTWKYKYGTEVDPRTDDAIHRATLHHIKNNPHHPEYHSPDCANITSTNRDKSTKCIDATSMPILDVAEMVCDWVAMSEELGTNTARQWYNKTKDVRWSYSELQEIAIDTMLKVFEGKENV